MPELLQSVGSLAPNCKRSRWQSKMEPMSVKTLKWSFLTLVVVCTSTVVWFVTQPLSELVTSMNWFYFYEYEPIYKNNFTFILREHMKCKDTAPFLVILVTSRPKDALTRHAIRASWGSVKMWQGHPVQTLFLLGKEPTEEKKWRESPKLEEESNIYGDIISQDFLDTYNNLTLKTIMAFRWVSEFCSNVKYVMKADSDVFINIGNLVNFVLQFNSSDTLFTGYPFIDNKTYRGFHQKSYISYRDYPFRIYPPYCSGLGYVFSGSLAIKMYDIMSHVKPIRFEDAYVGICLKILNMRVYVPDNQKLFVLEKIKFDTCTYKKLCAVHGLSPYEMITYWQAVQEPVECLSDSQR